MFSAVRKSLSCRQFLKLRVCSFCSAASKDVQEFYDVTIVGGGMVGASLACALGLERTLDDHKILLLEAAPDKPQNISSVYSNRVSNITPGSKKLLESIGAWEHICSMRYKPFKRMHVWDACSDAHISFNQGSKESSNSKDMGYIVENPVTLEALRKQLKMLQSRVKVLHGTKLKALKLPDFTRDMDDEDAGYTWAALELEDGRTIHSRLVIGADGPQSLVRKQASMDCLSWKYDQWGVVATLHLGEITENIVAWQKFLPTGPIALLPLTENLSSLVWSTTPEHAKNLVSMEEDRFVDSINNAFSTDVGRNVDRTASPTMSRLSPWIESARNDFYERIIFLLILWEDIERNPLVDQATRMSYLLASFIQPWTNVASSTQSPPSVSGVEEGTRAMFPYGFGHATEYVRPRLALIGDAAHRVHPLAGQGVNLGFGDVACLRDVLSEAAEEGKDIGSLEHLLTYETKRQQSVVPMITAIDALKRIYSTSSTLPVLARSVGLIATSALLPIKEQIISFAMR